MHLPEYNRKTMWQKWCRFCDHVSMLLLCLPLCGGGIFKCKVWHEVWTRVGIYVGNFWSHSKSPNLCRWPTYVNNLTLWQIELCTINCVNLQFWMQTGGRWGKQVRSPADELGTWSTVTGQLLLETFNLLPILVGKLRRLSGQQVVPLMHENFGSCTVRHKNYSNRQSANIGRWKLFRKHNTRCESGQGSR